MSYAAMVFSVMIAAPGDVQEERRIVREVIHEWNAINSKGLHLVLMPIAWETHSAPEMGDRPQAIINKQILRDCDLLVAVFWTRIGTDTGKAPSGTVEEIDEHIGQGKPAMLYFSNTPVRPDSVEVKQYDALMAFKQQCKSKGLIQEYDSQDDFRIKFTRQLNTIIQDKFQSSMPDHETISAQQAVQSELNEDAKKLLLTAVESNGYILALRTSDGTCFQAGETDLCRDKSRRVIARWEAALNQLLDNELIVARGNKGEVFEVTDHGYKVADQLKS